MKNDRENKMLQINANIRGHKPGDVIRVKVDKTGVPTDKYYRRRLKDAEHDGCCEWEVKKKKTVDKGV